MGGLRLAILGCLALALAACTTPQTAAPAAGNSAVMNDQLIGQIKRGETKKDQVRSIIGAPQLVNYQAGNEIWIYQGGSATSQRTLTVQYDQVGVVRNIGVTDMPPT